jgi:protease-4
MKLRTLRMKRLLLASTLGALALAERGAGAEPFVPRAERVYAPGRSASTDDTTQSMLLNPANLGFLPAGQLRLSGAWCEGTQRVGCGGVVAEAAMPFFFGLAGGVRFDYVRPPSSAPQPFGGHDYGWLTFALAWKISEALSIGTTLQTSMAASPTTNGLFGLSTGATFRPDSHLSFSFVLHDWNRGADPLPGTAYPVLDRSYVASVGIRPTGRRELEVAVDSRWLDQGVWIPRIVGAVDVPSVGRIRADVEVQEPADDARRGVVGTVGLELAWGHAQAGGGVAFGNGLGGADVGGFATVAASGWTQRPEIPRPKRAVTLRLESTPGSRGHVRLLQRLWRISETPWVDAVALQLKAEPAASLAHAEELADALRVLRARGKKVVCQLENNAAPSIYVCANADRVVMQPSGMLLYAGLKSQYFYLAGLLKKLGVKAEFARIGAHKSAPEQLTNERASDVARADHEDFLREREAVFTRNLALYRHLSEADVRARTAKGPFTPQEAKDAGFIDGSAYDDELERVLKEVLGHSVSVTKWEDETRAPESFGPRDRVAVLYLDGDMVDGRSQKIPLLGIKLCGSYTMVEAIKQLKDDSHVKAVVLRAESGGGSSIAGNVIWRELKLLAQKKPVIVSMGSIAASAAYEVSSAGRRIYALPLTATGSIGVFYGKVDVSGLLDKIGVNVETYRTTPRADGDSLFRPFTEDERQELSRKVGQLYDDFLGVVAEGRRMSKPQVDAVAQGRVWTGQQALDRGLVDRLGGIREALQDARQAAGLPASSPVVEYPVETPTLFERALDLAGISGTNLPLSVVPVQIKDAVRAVAPLAVYKDSVPLARTEWVPLENEDGEGD